MSKCLNIALLAAVALVAVAVAMAFPMLDDSAASASDVNDGRFAMGGGFDSPPGPRGPAGSEGMMGGFGGFIPMEPREAPPEVIIDVSDRPSDAPEDVIDAYGRAYNEKMEFEYRGSEVYILDRNGPADPELAGVLAKIMDERIIGEIPASSNAKVVSAGDAGNRDILGFLQIVYAYVQGSGSQLETVVTQMISSRASSGGSSYANVSENRGPVRIEIVTPQEEGGTEENAVKNIYSEIPAKPLSAETYLRLHVFDGGSSCF